MRGRGEVSWEGDGQGPWERRALARREHFRRIPFLGYFCSSRKSKGGDPILQIAN